MPLYDFHCETCDTSFEALVMNGEKVDCPDCHGTRIERLLSVPAKPRTGGASLPMSCHTDQPPCGPGCCRL